MGTSYTAAFFSNTVLSTTSTSDCLWSDPASLGSTNDCAYFRQSAAGTLGFGMVDTACDGTARCYACERSDCTIAADCVPERDVRRCGVVPAVHLRMQSGLLWVLGATLLG